MPNMVMAVKAGIVHGDAGGKVTSNFNANLVDACTVVKVCIARIMMRAVSAWGSIFKSGHAGSAQRGRT